ncbi:transcription factor Sox-19a-like [Anopheles albimanus]|uniref:transcription factor Sox-19a-like n=1 Tax=Anopheles albimanus TaxID=7167 RepID=UPI0016423123|nr:transcription factor Sox-19a-like [Anopheles albimanus]
MAEPLRKTVLGTSNGVEEEEEEEGEEEQGQGCRAVAGGFGTVACHDDHLKAAVRAVFDRSNWTPAAISARPLPKKKREYIKRPMNAFMVWAQTARPMIAGREPKMQNAEISKHLGTLWRQLSAEEKNPFVKRAEELREQHKKQYPDYKYQPRRKQAAKAAAAAAVAAATAQDKRPQSQPHQQHTSGQRSPGAPGSGNELEQQQQQYGGRMSSPVRGHGTRRAVNGSGRRRPTPYTNNRTAEITTSTPAPPPTTIWTVEYGHPAAVAVAPEPEQPTTGYHPPPAVTPHAQCQWVVPLVAGSPGDPVPDANGGCRGTDPVVATTGTTPGKHPDAAGGWDLLAPVTVSLAPPVDTMDGTGSPPYQHNHS